MTRMPGQTQSNNPAADTGARAGTLNTSPVNQSANPPVNPATRQPVNPPVNQKKENFFAENWEHKVACWAVSHVRACGNGSRQISLRPEWSNSCDWSGSIYSESEIQIQLSIRLFSLCDPLRVALGTEQNLG